MSTPAPVSEPVDTGDIDSVRAFNRFYTRQVGLLDQGLHGSEYTLTEARVLYELAHREGCTASQLTRDLGVDAGYLSRILKKLQRDHLIERRRTPSDRRQAAVTLTSRGRAAFEPLQSAARAQVDAMLKPMSARQRRALVSAMRTMQGVLSPEPPQTFPSRSAPSGSATLAGSPTARACCTPRSTAGTKAMRRWWRRSSPAS